MEQSKEHTIWKVGQLVRVKTHPRFLLQLHPFFVHPGQIWEGLSCFWNRKSTVRHWGDRCAYYAGQNLGQYTYVAPPFPREWHCALDIEYAYELGDKGITQRDICHDVIVKPGDTLMVLEVIVTPWKKRYRPAGGGIRRPRFSYVKFLQATEDSTRYLYLDISDNWADLKIDESLYSVIS